jgi:hypothetical protein
MIDRVKRTVMNAFIPLKASPAADAGPQLKIDKGEDIHSRIDARFAFRHLLYQLANFKRCAVISGVLYV